MIIGGNKDVVIDNIKKNIKDNELNKKVETNDPVLSDEQRVYYLKRFFKVRNNKLAFYLKNKIAYKIIDKYAKELNNSIEFVGLDNIKDIKNGAIITSNHFNPLDSLITKKMVKKAFNKNMYIVSQETNLAMPGMLEFLFNHLNIIPLSKSPNYIIKTFTPYLKEKLLNKNYVLIYPEEEMWFNYKKPRPCKRGAYQFAADANVPIISCFTEIIELDEADNEQFNKVKYKLHILKPIYPDNNKSVRENALTMAKIDYEQKCEAYEKIYGKKLDYKFSTKDIAGLKVYKQKEVNK